MEQVEEVQEVSDGSSARRVIAQFSSLSHRKQQREWVWWIGFYHCYLPYFSEDIRILEDLLDKENNR